MASTQGGGSAAARPVKGESRRAPGKKPSLEEAMEDAWRDASRQGATGFEIDVIEVRGSNPIDMYRVKGTTL